MGDETAVGRGAERWFAAGDRMGHCDNREWEDQSLLHVSRPSIASLSQIHAARPVPSAGELKGLSNSTALAPSVVLSALSAGSSAGPIRSPLSSCVTGAAGAGLVISASAV